MKIWVAITDRNWFEFLRARTPEEVNFWQPSSGRRAAALEPCFDPPLAPAERAVAALEGWILGIR